MSPFQWSFIDLGVKCLCLESGYLGSMSGVRKSCTQRDADGNLCNEPALTKFTIVADYFLCEFNKSCNSSAKSADS